MGLGKNIAKGLVFFCVFGFTEVNANTAESFGYPVQEFRLAIGNTDRNVAVSTTESGAYLTSTVFDGTQKEKWYLHYVSASVYEIVSSLTGFLLTNENNVIIASPDKDKANQRWKISAVEKDFEGYDLYYKIVNSADESQALTFLQNSNSLTVSAYSGNDFQKFKINLDGLEGYAANALVGGKQKAGTIGGLLGETVTVTSIADMISALNSSEPKTIVVNGNFDMATWDKTNQRIRDNKTLVGSYDNNTIYDCQFRNDDFYGKDASPSNNIVIRNLNLVAKTLNSTGSGVILFQFYGARQLWVDHNSFSATFNQNRDVEVGKFIWINTPASNWSDAIYNGVNPDYITISYNTMKNRYWTVAYGSQNKDTSRLRTTMMFNRWENCSRRTPQYSNGYHHNYSSFHTVTGSKNANQSSQIIAGEGSRVLSETCRFEAMTGSEIDIDRNSAISYFDKDSYTSSAVDGIPSKISIKSLGTAWNAYDSYGYKLVAGYAANGYDTKSFCNKFSGAFKKYASIKYITDFDLADYVSASYKAPFLESMSVGNAPVYVDIKPIDGILVKNLTLLDSSNYTDWNIKVSGVAIEDTIYGDRNFTITKISEELVGAEQIVTACDSKASSKDLATFIAANDMTLYIGLDSRLEKIPEWLSKAKKTEFTLTSSNDVTFTFYTLDVKAGELFTLGTNGQSSGCLNYVAFAKTAQKTTGIIASTDVDFEAMVHNGILQIKNSTNTFAKMTIFNINGKVIESASLASSEELNLNMKANYPCGFYIVRIQGKEINKMFSVNVRF